LIESGEYFIPEPPDINNYDLIDDPHGLNKATYLEQQKLFMKHWEDMHNNRAKLYAHALQYLSQESLSDIKKATDYETIKASRDVQSLWSIQRFSQLAELHWL
jgi:hypothetical protein